MVTKTLNTPSMAFRPIQPTSLSFPLTADIKNSVGLPLGLVIRPLVTDPQAPKHESMYSSELARCSHCLGYINPFCTTRRDEWLCSLCREPNRFSSTEESMAIQRSRFLNRDQCPEFTNTLIDAEVDDVFDSASEASYDSHEENALRDVPLFVFIVDIACSEEAMELIKHGIQATIASLPKHTRVGLITYADTINVYNLAAPMPSISSFALTNAQGDPMTQSYPKIAHLMDLEHFFVPIEIHEVAISETIDSLKRYDSDLSDLGDTLSLVSNFLMPLAPYGSAHACIFTSNCPNAGSGRCSTDRIFDASSDTLTTPAHDFYAQLGQSWCDMGIAGHLFVVSSQFVDIATIFPLVELTGGILRLYEDMENATLPQDMVRFVSPLGGSQVQLRIRTSPELSVSHHFGESMREDPHMHSLYSACYLHTGTSYAIDLEYTSGSGLESFPDIYPTIQLAVAYNRVDSNGRVARMLRVYTAQYNTASYASRVYDSTQYDVVLSLLVHKLLKASQSLVISRARALLFDWLTMLGAHCCHNQIIESHTKEHTKTLLAQSLTHIFEPFKCLRLFPRLVFSLLRNPMLVLGSVHPDERIYIRYLLSTLPSIDAASFVYPKLEGYSDIDESPAISYVQLSPDAVSTCITDLNVQIFVADTFSQILVYYPESSLDVPCPPPQDCKFPFPFRFEINILFF